MRAQELDNLREGHFIVVVWVNLGQEEFHFFLLMNDSHFRYQHFKLRLIQNSLLHVIDIFKHISKVLKELLMLLELKVKNQLLKVDVEELSLILLSHKGHNIIS